MPRKTVRAAFPSCLKRGDTAFRRQTEARTSEPLSPGDFNNEGMPLLQPSRVAIDNAGHHESAKRQRALDGASIRPSTRKLHGARFHMTGGDRQLMDWTSGQLSPVADIFPDLRLK